jgi:hypothetical protein
MIPNQLAGAGSRRLSMGLAVVGVHGVSPDGRPLGVEDGVRDGVWPMTRPPDGRELAEAAIPVGGPPELRAGPTSYAVRP